jgi:hypothetical protein
VARRIVDTALPWASAGGQASHEAPAHTYDTIQEAAEPLPKKLMGIMGLPTVAYRKVEWAAVDPREPVDWSALLK